MSNGSLVGLGKDNNLYWRSSLGNNWIQVPNGVSMNVVAQKNDGSFIGQGTDGKVYPDFDSLNSRRPYSRIRTPCSRSARRGRGVRWSGEA